MILFVNNNSNGFVFLGVMQKAVIRIVEWLIYESKITVKLIFNS